jgi:hypothetical protein
MKGGPIDLVYGRSSEEGTVWLVGTEDSSIVVGRESDENATGL